MHIKISNKTCVCQFQSRLIVTCISKAIRFRMVLDEQFISGMKRRVNVNTRIEWISIIQRRLPDNEQPRSQGLSSSRQKRLKRDLFSTPFSIAFGGKNWERPWERGWTTSRPFIPSWALFPCVLLSKKAKTREKIWLCKAHLDSTILSHDTNYVV